MNDSARLNENRNKNLKVEIIPLVLTKLCYHNHFPIHI